MKSVHRFLLPFLLLLAGPGLVSAQKPLGAELLVNDSIQPSGVSRVAANDAGELVISWIRQDISSGALSVYARRYGADGRPATGPIAVTNSLSGTAQQVVTMRADGSFAVAWTDRGKGTDSILRLRWYSAAGVLEKDSVVTREKVVNLAVAGREDGRFVLAWTSADDSGDPADPSAVRARVFAADRSPATPEILVDPLGAEPAVAIGPAGELAVAWVHGDPLPSPAIHLQVQMRRLGADGTPDGPVTTVSPPTELGPLTIQLGKDGQGNILLAESGTFEEWGQGTFVRRFRHDGKELGPTLHLNHEVRSLSLGQAGNFVVGWTEPLGDGSRDSRQIFARRFAEDGRPLGGNVAVTGDTPGHRSLGQVAIGTAGGFVVTWDSDQREFHSDVFVRRYHR